MTDSIISLSVGGDTALLVNGEVKTILSSNNTTLVTPVSRGPTGRAGDSVDSLEPRIAALEENTDGLVGGASPLSYYILARGT